MSFLQLPKYTATESAVVLFMSGALTISTADPRTTFLILSLFCVSMNYCVVSVCGDLYTSTLETAEANNISYMFWTWDATALYNNRHHGTVVCDLQYLT